jgi:hypothetical protein
LKHILWHELTSVEALQFGAFPPMQHGGPALPSLLGSLEQQHQPFPPRPQHPMAAAAVAAAAAAAAAYGAKPTGAAQYLTAGRPAFFSAPGEQRPNSTVPTAGGATAAQLHAGQQAMAQQAMAQQVLPQQVMSQQGLGRGAFSAAPTLGRLQYGGIASLAAGPSALQSRFGLDGTAPRFMGMGAATQILNAQAQAQVRSNAPLYELTRDPAFPAPLPCLVLKTLYCVLPLLIVQGDGMMRGVFWHKSTSHAPSV